MSDIIKDKMEIQELISLYSYAASVRDYDRVAAVFAPEATWQLFNHPEYNWKFGPPDLMAKIKEIIEPTTYLTQMNAPAVIEVDGDTATAASLINESGEIRPANLYFVMFGRYNDKLKRIKGKWLFTAREFTIIHMRMNKLDPSK
jgi:hypothetical protein